MKYLVRIVDECRMPYWNKDKQTLRHKDVTENETDSINDFKDIIKDYVDPSKVELVQEKIMEEWPEITEEGLKQYINYYEVRNRIYSEIINWIDETPEDEYNYFHFDFPSESNRWSPSGEIDKESTQIESSIWLEINKDKKSTEN